MGGTREAAPSFNCGLPAAFRDCTAPSAIRRERIRRADLGHRHGAMESPEESIDLPMIERAIEIEIADQSNAAITIRPRATSARVELRPFEKLAPERLALAEDAARRCLRGIETADSEGVSPFRQETFEPILKICGSQLDPGRSLFARSCAFAGNGTVPPAESDVLTVTDRYVLFARRRSANSVLRDIERFKAVLAPSEGDAAVVLRARRGPSSWGRPTALAMSISLSATRSGHSIRPERSEVEPIDPDHGDLFFPKPFNDDQVQIIRRLEKSDGLVVQGPPGTGKTHTIANIICHMLATGRRVLVVSHGETAFSVVRDQFRKASVISRSAWRLGAGGPEASRKSDRPHARHRECCRRQPSASTKPDPQLEANIVKSRKRLAEIDERTATIAARHLSRVPGGTETPYQIAKRVVEDRALHEWFTDRPDRVFVESGIDDATIVGFGGCSQARWR